MWKLQSSHMSVKTVAWQLRKLSLRFSLPPAMQCKPDWLVGNSPAGWRNKLARKIDRMAFWFPPMVTQYIDYALGIGKMHLGFYTWRRKTHSECNDGAGESSCDRNAFSMCFSFAPSISVPFVFPSCPDLRPHAWFKDAISVDMAAWYIVASWDCPPFCGCSARMQFTRAPTGWLGLE